MKRTDLIEDMASAIIMYDITIDYQSAKEYASIALNKAEEAGMLPPINDCKLIPHEDGGMKHSPSKREWDLEEEIQKSGAI